jgi:excisionase family DNA binding protein
MPTTMSAQRRERVHSVQPEELIEQGKTKHQPCDETGKRPTEGRWFTAKQVADLIGVSTRHVYDMGNEGQLPEVDFGDRSVRFPREDVMQWIADKEAEAQEKRERRASKITARKRQ